MLTACDIFGTRTPEAPSQTSSTFTPPTDPSMVFTNLANAIHDLSTVNYLRSFADSSTSSRSFQFDPTPQARSLYGGVFLNWNRQSEQQYFENLRSKIASGSAASLELLSLTAQSIQSDSAQYEATYRLTVPHTQSNIATVFQGRAQFLMITDRSRTWSIWRWIDLGGNQNEASWSDLKGAFAQ
jgi:hypothetical protein